MSAPAPRYPGLLADALPILPGLFSRHPRSVHADAVRMTSRLQPPLVVHGVVPRLTRGLFLINHYGRSGFPSWWLGAALSSVIPSDIHWVMTASWEFKRGLRKHMVTPLTRCLFRRIARQYDFTTMPAMPPRPEELQLRAAAVRRLLRVVDERSEILVGLAPEGDDCEQRMLGDPPIGAGRLIRLLSSKGLVPVPVGIYEQDGALHLHLGQPLLLASETSNRPHDDAGSINTVMLAIAACLPEHLRGKYT
ncbi:MAG: hypothetical protein JXA97_03355 [Anaerolineales bacterium]|nr:hypothetical protein [Anaerolineales bacterium]